VKRARYCDYKAAMNRRQYRTA